MKKKLLALFTAVVLVMSLSAVAVGAASTKTIRCEAQFHCCNQQNVTVKNVTFTVTNDGRFVSVAYTCPICKNNTDWSASGNIAAGDNVQVKCSHDLKCYNTCPSHKGCKPTCAAPCECVCECDLNCYNECPSNEGCTPTCGNLCDCACSCDLECKNTCPSNEGCGELECGEACDCICECDLTCYNDCPNSDGCTPVCGELCDCECNCPPPAVVVTPPVIIPVEPPVVEPYVCECDCGFHCSECKDDDCLFCVANGYWCGCVCICVDEIAEIAEIEEIVELEIEEPVLGPVELDEEVIVEEDEEEEFFFEEEEAVLGNLDLEEEVEESELVFEDEELFILEDESALGNLPQTGSSMTKNVNTVALAIGLLCAAILVILGVSSRRKAVK